MDRILGRHLTTFMDIFTNASDLDRAEIPVLAFIDESLNDGTNESSQRKRKLSGIDSVQRNLLQQGTVDFPGDLSPEDQARLANWLYEKILATLQNSSEPSSMQEIQWNETGVQANVLGKAVLAHAITIYISETRNIHPLRAAFDFQLNPPQPDFRAVDVDRECLTLLEQRMLATGLEVWGLNAGPHQDNWDPYDGVRDKEKRSTRELKVGANKYVRALAIAELLLIRKALGITKRLVLRIPQLQCSNPRKANEVQKTLGSRRSQHPTQIRLLRMRTREKM